MGDRSLKMKNRFIVGVMIGLCGLLVGLLCFLITNPGSEALPDGLSLDTFLFVSFTGALIAGSLVSPLFGGGGGRGWVLAFLGALIATLVGAWIGALLFVLSAPEFSLMGPYYVFWRLLIDPEILCAWVIAMSAIHHSARKMRQQQTWHSGTELSAVSTTQIQDANPTAEISAPDN